MRPRTSSPNDRLRGLSKVPAALVTPVILVILIILGCPDPRVVGPEGGVVSSEGGARLFVPPASLSGEQRISMTDFANREAVAKRHGQVPVAGLVGAVELGPSGLEFASPARLTVPVFPGLRASPATMLAVWNADAQRWQVQREAPVVSADGSQFEAPISHFSLFGGLNLPAEVRLFDELSRFVSESHHVQAAIETYADWLLLTLDLDRFRAELDGHCYGITHYELVIDFAGPGATGDTYRIGPGSKTDMKMPMGYQLNAMFEGQEYEFEIDVFLYLSCVPPRLELAPAATRVDALARSSVGAELMCGSEAMPAGGLDLSVTPPGLLSTHHLDTDAKGRAKVELWSAGATGSSDVSATYLACEGEGPSHEVMASTNVEFTSAKQTWAGVLDMRAQSDCYGWDKDCPLVVQGDYRIEFEVTIDWTWEAPEVEGPGDFERLFPVIGAGKATTSLVQTGTDSACRFGMLNAADHDVEIRGATIGGPLRTLMFVPYPATKVEAELCCVDAPDPPQCETMLFRTPGPCNDDGLAIGPFAVALDGTEYHGQGECSPSPPWNPDNSSYTIDMRLVD